jgi:hypothetical protein
MSNLEIRKNNKKIEVLVQDVTETLLDCHRHQTPVFGTFSTCTELRAYAIGGRPPSVSGPHSEAVRAIVEAMQSEEGIEIPRLGRLTVVAGKNPKLIFHGAEELNRVLANV